MTMDLRKSRLLHLCIAISYFTSGLIINFAQLMLHLFVKPFNKKLYRSLMYYLCFSFYSQLVFISDWWSNTQLRVYIDDETLKKYVGKEHVLLIMNHTYEIDWLMGWVFCEKVGVLGNCKAYAKKVIQYFPAVGWAWKFAEFVFLERSFEKDREIIQRQLSEIYDYPDPAWLLLNAEGTRFTEKKHEASIKFARERGMPELKHHLIPRTKGFIASLPVLKKKCPAIYDIQLAFKKNDPVEPTVSNLLFGHQVIAYMVVRRIPLSDVPEDPDKASLFLQNLFEEKDRLQESFHTNDGDFFATSGVPRIPLNTNIKGKRLCTLINAVTWMVITLTPILYYLGILLFSGRLFLFSVGILILITFYVLLQKSIGMSKISKASSYGSESGQKPKEQ